MRIGVPVETAAAERRVALVPDSVARLVKAGHQVRVQRGAGAGAFHSDDSYSSAGATLVEGPAIFNDVDMVVASSSSQQALEWLNQGKVHVAGSHLRDSLSGEYNLPGPGSANTTEHVDISISPNKPGNFSINLSIWGAGDFNAGPPDNVAPVTCNVAVNS